LTNATRTQNSTHRNNTVKNGTWNKLDESNLIAVFIEKSD